MKHKIQKVELFIGVIIFLGGLLTYGTNYEALGRQTAKMAIKIIEGADVSETAVEYPETVSLHINEDIAKQLGIDTSKLSISE